jgi:hypothetical protein
VIPQKAGAKTVGLGMSPRPPAVAPAAPAPVTTPAARYVEDTENTVTEVGAPTPPTPAAAPVAMAPPRRASQAPPPAPVPTALASYVTGQGAALTGDKGERPLTANAVREIVAEVVAEMLKPAADRMRAMEQRLAHFEKLAQDALAANQAAISMIPISMSPTAPPVQAAAPPMPPIARPPVPVIAPVVAPAPVAAPQPPAVPAPATPGSSPNAFLADAGSSPFTSNAAAPSAPLLPDVSSSPALPGTGGGLPLAPSAPRFESMVDVGSDDLAAFSGSRRQRRLAIGVTLVILALVGGLVAAMIASRSG